MKLTCNICKLTLDETQFSKNATKLTGYNYKCKKCHSLYIKTRIHTATSDPIECSSCNIEKPAVNFSKNKGNTNGRNGKCSSCIVSYKDDHAKHKRLAKNKAFMDRYKLMVGCALCGYKEHAVALDFDHIDQTTKNRVGKGMDKKWSRDRIKNEIRKCRVLCSNCHRVETIRQDQHLYVSK
jgi:hypothetical protein